MNKWEAMREKARRRAFRAVMRAHADKPGAIPWAMATWNFFVGCWPKSRGCRACYAIQDAHRMAGKLDQFKGLTERRDLHAHLRWTGKVNLNSEAKQREPLTTRRPTLFFANSLSDFFYEGAPHEWRRDMIRIMRDCRQHLFVVLTKRPEHARDMLTAAGVRRFPVNVILGVSIENADNLDRLDMLRAEPRMARWLAVSAEPLVGDLGTLDLTGIDWVIAGGESGAAAQKCRLAWVRRLRDQCAAQAVPFFFKQWGSARYNPLASKRPEGISFADYIAKADPHEPHGGCLLDGRLHREMPRFRHRQ